MSCRTMVLTAGVNALPAPFYDAQQRYGPNWVAGARTYGVLPLVGHSRVRTKLVMTFVSPLAANVATSVFGVSLTVRGLPTYHPLRGYGEYATQLLNVGLSTIFTPNTFFGPVTAGIYNGLLGTALTGAGTYEVYPLSGVYTRYPDLIAIPDFVDVPYRYLEYDIQMISNDVSAFAAAQFMLIASHADPKTAASSPP